MKINDIVRHKNFLIAGAILLYFLSVLIHLGYVNLQGEEPRRAIISIEMLKSGEYIVPHALGWEYYNKPPLFNWILCGFIYITGSDSEFVLRLPSLLFLLLWGFCHYLVCRKFFSPSLALLSAFFMMTSADLFFYGLANGAEIDIFYSWVVYLQVVSVFWFYQKKKWGRLFLFSWLFCAIGFLTKGFPSLVFQALTLAALSVHARSIKLLFKPWHLAGIFCFLLLAGSYFYVYSSKGDPSIMLLNLVNESLKKSAVGEESQGIFFKIITYPVLLFKLLAPWCLILFVLFSKQRFRLFDNPLVKFSFLFVVFNIGVYWFTGVTKQRYVYMFIPFIMNIIVHLYGQFEQKNPGLINKYLKPAGILFCILPGGIAILPFFFELNLWLLAGLAFILLVFIIIFFRQEKYRLWLFITGILLARLAYSVIGIPVQDKGLFDYRPSMAMVAQKTRGHTVSFFLPPDTLKLDVVIGDTLYKWPADPVPCPPFLFHQMPYYFYRSGGSILQYDTSLSESKYYISYLSHLRGKQIEPIYSVYYKKLEDSLVLFRLKPADDQ